jgi:hypothetical protein
MKTRTPLPLSGLFMPTFEAITVTRSAGAGYGRVCRDTEEGVARAHQYQGVPPSPSKPTRFDRNVSCEGPL